MSRSQIWRLGPKRGSEVVSRGSFPFDLFSVFAGGVAKCGPAYICPSKLGES